MAQLLGDEVDDVLLDLERLVRGNGIAVAFRAVGRCAVLHPGPQAPPFRPGTADLVGKIRVADVGVVDLCRVPGEVACLLAQLPDLGQLHLGNDRVRIGVLDDLFEH